MQLPGEVIHMLLNGVPAVWAAALQPQVVLHT